MDAACRRQRIWEELRRTDHPISATALAERLGVSRQIIVGDVALLRAAGAEIAATPRGYMPRQSHQGLLRTVACCHGAQEMETELNAIVDDMRRTYEQKPSKAPTAEQLAILQALKMRDSVSKDELREALNAVKGCPLAERVVGELAAKHHHVLGMERELTSDTVRRSLDSLRLNGERLISKLEQPGEDRRAAVNRGDYTMFLLDQEPKDEADAMRIFGSATDYGQFSEAVNGEQ